MNHSNIQTLVHKYYYYYFYILRKTLYMAGIFKRLNKMGTDFPFPVFKATFKIKLLLVFSHL